MIPDVLLDQALSGNLRALARIISRIENNLGDPIAVLQRIYPLTGHATIIGITGSPGSGKSTLCDALVRCIRAAGQRVAVLAVDPSSPFSGGAILGDRIRMLAHAADTGVYIRSMSARGHLGGLARATRLVAHLLDACGWPVIVIETVGVGQSELEIAKIAGTTAVVLTPGAGDTIQTMKAGLLEIADLFVINKKDHPGSAALARDVRAMLIHDAPSVPGAWEPRVLLTQATTGDGLPDLWAAIGDHQRYLVQTESGQTNRRQHVRDEIRAAALDILSLQLDILLNSTGETNTSTTLQSLADDVANRCIDPYTAARHLLKNVTGIQGAP